MEIQLRFSFFWEGSLCSLCGRMSRGVGQPGRPHLKNVVFMEGTERRENLNMSKESKKTDIRNEQDVTRLVHTFYGYVQKNERLNYIFGEVADVDWNHHLPNMVDFWSRSEEHTSELQSRGHLVCRLLLEKKK